MDCDKLRMFWIVIMNIRQVVMIKEMIERLFKCFLLLVWIVLQIFMKGMVKKMIRVGIIVRRRMKVVGLFLLEIVWYN